MGEFVIRELHVAAYILSAVWAGLSVGGCAPHRDRETVSDEARSTRRGNADTESGESGATLPLTETCVPENAGPLGVRVKGRALSPDRVFKTNDRKAWPVYGPPEEVRVTLPEMPPELAQSSGSSADGDSAAKSQGKAVQPEGEKTGDRSSDTNGTGREGRIE